MFWQRNDRKIYTLFYDLRVVFLSQAIVVVVIVVVVATRGVAKTTVIYRTTQHGVSGCVHGLTPVKSDDSGSGVSRQYAIKLHTSTIEKLCELKEREEKQRRTNNAKTNPTQNNDHLPAKIQKNHLSDHCYESISKMFAC